MLSEREYMNRSKNTSFNRTVARHKEVPMSKNGKLLEFGAKFGINMSVVQIVTNVAMATLPPGAGAVCTTLTRAGALLLGNSLGNDVADSTIKMAKKYKKAIEEDGFIGLISM